MKPGTDDKKKKNNITMILLLLGVLAIFGGGMYFISNNVGKNKTTGTTTARKHYDNIDFNIVDDEDTLVKTRFLNKTEADIRRAGLDTKKTRKEVDELKRTVRELQKQVKEQKISKQINKIGNGNTGNLPSPGNRDFSDIFQKFPNGLPNNTDANQENTPHVKNPFKKAEEVSYEYEEIKESVEVGLNGKKDEAALVKANGKAHSANVEKIPDDAFFIPAGSVTVAYLEQGYDAPTLKNGKSDLVPSTLTIVGYTLLPNNKLYDMRGCKVLAEAEGKRSNSRSYSRTKRLSCIDDKNGVMDIPMRGYISDEEGDGKLGLKGGIVSMQNEFLQNAVWVGIVEGLANIGKVTAMNQTATAQGGVVNTIKPGKEFQAGFAGSVGETTSSIKDFLMDNVKSIEPVVEIKGGRLVAITLSEGIYIYPRIEYKGRQ
jgi:hypothetical protein